MTRTHFLRRHDPLRFLCVGCSPLGRWAIVGYGLLLSGLIAIHSGLAMAEPTAGSPYGVIEVGSKGVKAYAFDYERAQTPGCQEDGDRYLGCLNLQQVPPVNVSPIKETALQDTVAAVATQEQELMQRYAVAPDRLFVVLSSGLSTIPHRDNLIASIAERINPKNPIDLISADNEAQYALNGVLQMIPARYRSDRRRTAVLMDIGSGNTKGSYIEKTGKSERFVSLSVPWGTTTVTKEIDEHRGDVSFTAAAETWRKNVLLPILHDEFERKPGAVNRQRVYLLGGLPWALVTLTQPQDKHKFPPINIEQIDRLYRDATADDAEARLCQNSKTIEGSDIDRVCNAFSVNNLVAGLQILKALVQEMKLDKRNKLIFFFRDSQFAWPLGYLQNRIKGDEKSP
jgi:hypothetical protein